MRALKKVRDISSRPEACFEGLLAHLSAATQELTPALNVGELARRLTARASEIMGARAAVLALRDGANWEIAALSGSAGAWDPATRRDLAHALGQRVQAPHVARHQKSAAALLGKDLAQALAWTEIALVPLATGDAEPLGTLWLADIERGASDMHWQTIEAISAHAAVTIENGRLFAQVERAKKQWVGDFDAISDFIVVHDGAGRVLRLNRTLADSLGVRLADAIGQNLEDLHLLGAATSTGLCSFCRDKATSHEEFVHIHAGRTYLISTSRIQAPEELRRTIHVMKDITDRREAEHRYCRERDFNKSIVDNTQSIILVLNAQGSVTYANRRCAEAGYRHRDILGRDLTDLVLPSRRSALAEAIGRSLRGIPQDHLETSLHGSNGAVRQFSMSLSPMRDDRGEINRVVAVMNEVTDAVDLQAKLVRADKMAALGQLVSGVAHEVNNPLSAIIGFTDLLLESEETTPRAKQELGVIMQEAQRTRAIVENLLRFARQAPTRREPVQIHTILRHTLKLRSYDFSKRGMQIVERYDEDLPLVVADPQQLQQVFLNILNNAYDATSLVRRPGRIEIATSRRDGFAEISFRDNGSGISHPDRIFDPFFTTKEVGKGTGLGLSICYGIMRAHDGEITAANNSDGIGCTFTLRLRAAHPASPGDDVHAPTSLGDEHATASI